MPKWCVSFLFFFFFFGGGGIYDRLRLAPLCSKLTRYIFVMYFDLNQFDIVTGLNHLYPAKKKKKKKRNAPLGHSSIVLNRMNANICEFNISYINQSLIDIMKVI